MGRVFSPLGTARKPRNIVKSDDQVHTVACPICGLGVGFATVHKKPSNDGFTVDLLQLLQCETCNRFFGLTHRTILVGKPIEEQQQTVRERRGGLSVESARGGYTGE